MISHCVITISIMHKTLYHMYHNTSEPKENISIGAVAIHMYFCHFYHLMMAPNHYLSYNVSHGMEN